MSWIVWALLSALFAGLTGLLAKLGLASVPANLATAIRTTIALVMTWSIALWSGEAPRLHAVLPRGWLFLVLSGIAGCMSWICYFRALSQGELSRVAPLDKLSFVLAAILGIVILHERVTWTYAAGLVLVVVGILMTTIKGAP